MLAVRPIHPFPARMAPEIALSECKRLPRRSVVLDPMAGSGTVLRYAAEAGHQAIGYDLDPLSTLMSKVWNTPIDVNQLLQRASRIAEQAWELSREIAVLPWIDNDEETRRFVNYWFGRKQRKQLRALSSLLQTEAGSVGDALRIALSRTIVTKEPQASLARDTSHSRPHRVMTKSDFGVIDGFVRSAGWLSRRLADQPPPGDVDVCAGDARNLPAIQSSSVDAVISSPPYLNAIDYMRGHRMSLVWLGHTLGELRSTRSHSIGSERQVEKDVASSVAEDLVLVVDPVGRFSRRLRGIVKRYAVDMLAVVGEIDRVLRPGAKAVLVVGNSCTQGSFVESAFLVSSAAQIAGLRLENRVERPLPASRRYLPPPATNRTSGMDSRMRTETILTFRKVNRRLAA